MTTTTDTAGEHGRHVRRGDLDPATAGGHGTHGAPETHHGHAAEKGNKWWTLVAVCLGTFMLLLDITIVNVALPNIQQALHASFSDLQWVVDAYALTLAALLLTAGSLADIYGRKRIYAIGLVIFTLASLACGLAPTHLFLELARAAQGIGGAVMFSVSLALLADAFRGKERGTAFGIWGAVTGVAVAIGPLLGGVLTSALSWRWIFFVNLPVGAAALALVLLRVHESKAPTARRPDIPGFLSFSVALAALIYGLIESNERGFGSSRVIASFVLAVVLLAVFLVAEARGRNPMFDLSLFRLPTFTGGLIGAFGLSASIFSMFLYLVLYLQDLLGFSPLQTGLRLLIFSGGILVTSTVAGRLSAHVPVRWLIGPGLLLVAVGLFLMGGVSASGTWTHLIPGFIVAGIGIGLVNPPLASTAVGVVEPQRAGMASGINSTFRQVGTATGIALLGTLFATRSHSVVTAKLAAVPGLGGHSRAIAAGLQSGQLGKAIAALPVGSREAAGLAARQGFTSGLNLILMVAAIVALLCGLVCLVTIRTKDFVKHTEGAPAGGH